MATHHKVLTIGHSNHTIERFIELLCQHRVTAVADVRSSPYSQMHAQFNREALAAALKQEGIAYSFLGKELGKAGRQDLLREWPGPIQKSRCDTDFPVRTGSHPRGRSESPNCADVCRARAPRMPQDSSRHA